MQCHTHHHFISRISRSLHNQHNFPFLILPSITIPKFKIPKKFLTMSFSSISQESQHQQPTDEIQRLNLLQALNYHQQTKHHFTNYARGPGRLDWANQPNPFRRYISSPLINLQHYSIEQEENLLGVPLYSSVFNSLPPPKPLSFSSISQLFYDSLALSAWKTTGFSTWSLRVNPSSGNLHPTEAYLIAPPIGLISNSGFVAHYAPKEHGLEIRAEFGSGFFDGCLPKDCFLVGFSSIFWREAWKYGERAFRYCNHDIGHAIASVSMAASGLGWDVKLLDGLGFNELEKLMGLENFPKLPIPSRPVKGKFPEIEMEHPDCVLAVFPRGEGDGFDVNYEDLKSRISGFSNLDWKGKPNMLSKEHVVWDVIYKTSESVKKPFLVDEKVIIDPFQCSGVCSDSSYKGFTLREVVRKRRSAVDMDGVTIIHRDTFYQMLLHCLPSGMRNGEKQGKQLALPFRALSWDSEVHAVLFVHRVSGLPKGVYFLVRNENHFDDLKKSTRPEFTWRKPEGCPAELPLYELVLGDCIEISKRLSCLQVNLQVGDILLKLQMRTELSDIKS